MKKQLLLILILVISGNIGYAKDKIPEYLTIQNVILSPTLRDTINTCLEKEKACQYYNDTLTFSHAVKIESTNERKTITLTILREWSDIFFFYEYYRPQWRKYTSTFCDNNGKMHAIFLLIETCWRN